MDYEDAKRELETIRSALSRLGIRTAKMGPVEPGTDQVCIPMDQSLGPVGGNDFFRISVQALDVRPYGTKRLAVSLDQAVHTWRESTVSLGRSLEDVVTTADQVAQLDAGGVEGWPKERTK